jgi:hypothetical protein
VTAVQKQCVLLLGFFLAGQSISWFVCKGGFWTLTVAAEGLYFVQECVHPCHGLICAGPLQCTSGMYQWIYMSIDTVH